MKEEGTVIGFTAEMIAEEVAPKADEVIADPLIERGEAVAELEEVTMPTESEASDQIKVKGKK